MDQGLGRDAPEWIGRLFVAGVSDQGRGQLGVGEGRDGQLRRTWDTFR